MAITFVDFALSGTTDSTTLNITLPTVQAGDVMFLEYTHRGTGTGTLGGDGGSGWSSVRTQLYATDTFSLHHYWKRCDGSESGDALTVTGLTDSCAGCVTVYRGCVATGDPVEVFTGESNISGNETHAAITTLTNGAWVVLTVANSPDSGVSGQSTTSPGALGERAERLNTTGTDTSIAHASAEKALAGTTGALTWSQTNAASGSIAYAITPALPQIALPAGALVLAGVATALAFLGPFSGTVAVAGAAPTVQIQAGTATTIEIPAGALGVTGATPGLSWSTALSAGGLQCTGQPPGLSQLWTLPVPAGALTVTGGAPAGREGLAAPLPAGGITVTGAAPVAAVALHVTPAPGGLAVAGAALSIGGATAVILPAGGVTVAGVSNALQVALSPAAGALGLTGAMPSLARGLGVPAGALGLAGAASSLTITSTGQTLSVAAGTLTVTGAYVAVAFLQPAPGALTIAGAAPVVMISGVNAPGAGALGVTGAIPSLARGLGVPAGALILTGVSPDVVGSGAIAIPPGGLTVAGVGPSLLVPQGVAVPTGGLILNSSAPTLTGAGARAPEAGALTVTGATLVLAHGLPLAAGGLAVTGAPGDVLAPQAIGVPAGALVVSGLTPLVTSSAIDGCELVDVAVRFPSVTAVTVTFPIDAALVAVILP